MTWKWKSDEWWTFKREREGDATNLGLEMQGLAMQGHEDGLIDVGREIVGNNKLGRDDPLFVYESFTLGKFDKDFILKTINVTSLRKHGCDLLHRKVSAIVVQEHVATANEKEKLKTTFHAHNWSLDLGPLNPESKGVSAESALLSRSRAKHCRSKILARSVRMRCWLDASSDITGLRKEDWTL